MKRLTVLLLLSLMAFACKKEKTVWESDWAAPLINDTLSLANLTNDSTLSESSGFYELDLTRTLFNLKVSDFVAIPDTTIIENFVPAGAFNVNPGGTFSQPASDGHVINLDEIQLKHIILKAGYIDVRVENPLGTTTVFNVQLPGTAKNGVPFSNQYAAPPGTQANPGVAEESIDLAGYEIDLTGSSGGDFNVLQSLISVSTDVNGPAVFVTPSDVTKVEATFRDVEISYARGYFGNRVVADTSDLNLDVMNAVASGMIDLPNTSITFKIENGIKVSAEGTITIAENVNNTGSLVQLTGGQMGSSFNIDPATGTWDALNPSVKTINFNSSNSNIEDYIENLGAKHKLGYKLQMNPWGNVSGGYDELFETSKLRILMEANMPLNIGVDQLVLRDTFDVQINQDPDKTRIKSGELILQASNGFPISGSIKLHLRNEAGTVLHTIAGSSELASGLFGNYSAEHGFSVANSEIRFVLSEEVLNDINDVYSIVVESTFNSLDPNTGVSAQMSIPFGAFLAVKLKTKLTSENKF